MKYKNSNAFKHSQASKVGVLITNLGTPQAPTTGALRRYLKEFLSDPRVVEFPRLLWWFILNVIILNLRPRRSAKAYKTVWTEQGSPLALHTEAQAEALSAKIKARYGDAVELDWAMRYGKPSVENAIQNMQDKGVKKLIVLPLYPQYSCSTTASTFDAIAQDFTQRRWLPELRFVADYHDFPAYIAALAATVTQHWETHGKADKLIFSYHGTPLRYLHKGDPYHCQCLKTSRLVAEQLGLAEDQYLIAFQSIFGREQWLQPYTEATLKALPAQGVESVQIICPGFSADCLETIEEIDVENRSYFETAGGKRYEYIAALNSRDEHIDALDQLIEKHMQGWHEDIEAFAKVDLEAREARAQSCPFNQPL